MRYVDTKADRPRWRFTTTHRFTPRFQAGVEVNPGADEIGPIANWIALTETDKQPMVNFGTSSDRIFSPKGTQSYYMTVAKSLPALRAAPYVSLFWSEWEDRFLFPFGANFSLSEQWDLMGMNDGRNSHALMTYKRENDSLSLMLIKMRYPGVSYSFGF
jgi:hypothetical protein